MLALRLDRLLRRYGEREALFEVSLTLQRGATLAVLGANGAGKTTLLRVIASLLRPHGGTVEVLGSMLPSQAWAVRGRVGLLSHEPLLYRELSARENLRFHARLHGVPDRRVEELLEAVAMRERAQEPVKTLSRGMVQRVAIARTVLHAPELLLLDEPRANLDPAAAELVEPLIGRDGDPTHRSARPRTRVLAGHDPRGALEEADLVLGLRGGEVAMLAGPDEVDVEQVMELYR